MTEKYVYRIYGDSNALLYVGVTTDPRRRIAQHGRSSKWFVGCHTKSVDGPYSRKSADFIEGMAIRFERPKHNKNARKCADFPSLDLSGDGMSDRSRRMIEDYTAQFLGPRYIASDKAAPVTPAEASEALAP